ncbi:MBL fold metallo-hydrolase [Bacillus horti]|uniref:L-ascorbate metabolism protein UlaG (Beta-lactamase superfamily) n=1 Tax=Caldalkalibacillus horti TaxID=77523 RepID=A0ABT9W2U9_9BACI|nr:MBL fold metallo-hydrolase [Bacillus horti]MDQ0167160.1 L-ascorbate metabolism protein UlaG (beta-lactamase superfamily) [Bacillus horti]
MLNGILQAFGLNSIKNRKQKYDGLANFSNGKFVNSVPTEMSMGASNVLSMMRDYMSGGKDRRPSSPIQVSSIDWNKVKREEDSLTWFGHSAFLLSIDNKKLLVDPMLGPVASPVSFAGSKRYSKDTLSIIDEMPFLDAVFITHDHYDHLDYHSIKRLKSKVGHFFVPHGVGAHLSRWGVAEEKITELNWWDEMEFQGLTIALTPSKHFSGRGMFNRDTSLWGGWVILGQHTRFYTSGDGGYDSHFKEIGKKYGPFNLTLIEGGQYDKRWDWVHMTPEEAVQAHLDVNGENMMLIHWGAFTLAFHGWTEPVERAIKKAREANVPLMAPKIGETVPLRGEYSVPFSAWWKD